MSAPRLSGPRVALVPEPTADPSWAVHVEGTPVGAARWAGPPDADGTVVLTWSLPTDPDLRAEAMAVLLTWSAAQPGVRGVVVETAADDPDRALLAALGAAERPAPHGRVLLVVGRVPVRGRHVC